MIRVQRFRAEVVCQPGEDHLFKDARIGPHAYLPSQVSALRVDPCILGDVAAVEQLVHIRDRYLRNLRTREVCVAVVLAVVLCYLSPARAVAMKPLGDGFIRLITMIIMPIIFCTVVSGIAGMQDMKKVGRVGGKALLYFEVVSTLALFIGLVVGNVVHPGAAFHVNPTTLDAKAVASYAGAAKAKSATDFVMHIIPTTIVDAFAKGDISRCCW